jgi:O-antigen ligase
VLTLLWVIGQLASGRTLGLRLHASIPLLFLAALAWAWLQATGWLPDAWSHPVWQLVGEYSGLTVTGTVSLSPQDNYTAVMRLLAYGLVFFLAFQLARDRRIARRAMWWVTIAAVLYSVYGLLSFWGDLRELMWYQDDAYGRDVRATFVNRNHFANWLGIATLCALAAFFDHMLRAPYVPTAVMPSRQRRLERFLSRAWAPLAGLVLMISALVSTHSRGGFLATICGGAVLLFLVDRKLGAVSTRARAIAFSALAVSMMAFYISSEVLIDRLEQSGMDAEGRSTIYQLTLGGISDNPALGFGYGAYQDGFKLYRDERVTKLVDFAHNTFLENLFELGVPAAVCLFGAVLGLTLTCVAGLARRRRDWMFPAAGIAVTVMVSVHALVDFGLQLPAVAMLYALVMGVACAQSYSSR